MSITKQTTVWCDVCGSWFMDNGPASRVRRLLRKRGWVQIGTLDYCPEHATPEQRAAYDEQQTPSDEQQT